MSARGWSRREMIALAAATTACGADPLRHTGRGQGPDEAALAEAAALYAIAPFEFVQQARRNAERGGPNRLSHRPGLSVAADRAVTTPNNDTLYSAAMLDLAAAPVVVSAPASPDRYLSIGIHSAFTDVEALISARDTAAGPTALTVCGPEWQGDAAPGTRLARLSTNDAWLISRVLVAADADLDAARERQQAVGLAPYPGLSFSPARSWLPAGAIGGDPADRLETLNHLLTRSPRVGQAARASRFAAFGVGEAEPGALARLSPERRNAWIAAAAAAEISIAGGIAARGFSRSGWGIPASNLAQFGEDDLFRASVARSGLGALPLSEAAYLTLEQSAPAGRPVAFRFTMPPDPPTDGFWSLTLYAPEPDGRRFFFDNPLGRYALGDRTPGLKRARDGAVAISISSDAPSDSSNWLPAPAGPFVLLLRLYLPHLQVAAGDWAPGPLEPL